MSLIGSSREIEFYIEFQRKKNFISAFRDGVFNDET